MPRVNDLRPALNAGELSPRMAARVDFAKYPAGAATVKNMIPLPQGGLMRRPGTRFVKTVKDESAKARVLEFEFNTEQAYIVEAGNTYFRFIRNQGQITTIDVTASITNGTFDTDLTGWTDRSGAGSSISHNGTLNAMNLTSNGTTLGHAEQQVTNAEAVKETLQFRVIGAPGDEIKLRVGTASLGTEIVNDRVFEVGYHVYTFTATAADFFLQFINEANKAVQIDNVALLDNVPLELETPYLTADLFTLKTAQSADVMYIAHDTKNPIYKLTRTDHDQWSLIEVAWDDGPYFDKNTTSTTLTSAAVSGNGITVTASAVTGINDNEGFKSTDVGRTIRIDDGSAEPGWGIIVTFTSTTVVDMDIKRNVVLTAETGWSLGAWSETTGWPKTVGFFEQRFMAASASKRRQTFWGSQSADLENMRADSFVSGSIAIEDDDAILFTLAAKKVNSIEWLDSGTQFIIGTAGGEWIATSDGPILTPTDIQLLQHTAHGSAADTEALRVGAETLFLQRSQRKIRGFGFNFEVDGFRAPDLTILANHITKSKVTEIHYQQEPESIVWALRTDGVAATMTFRRIQDVAGWSRQILGGSFGTGDAVIDSIAVIPGNDGAGQVQDSTERNEVWVIVKRTINGATKRYIEFFEGSFEGPDRNDFATEALWETQMVADQKNTYYSDSLLTLDDPKTISGGTKANPVVITATSHGFANGDQVRISDVVGMVEINDISFKVANKTANTFEITNLADVNIDGTGFTAYSSGGNVRLEVTSITGLTHVQGETVKVLADGKVHPDQTVSGTGTITLDYKASIVQVGLGFTHQFQSLKNIAGAAAGTGVGRVKRISEITYLLLDAAAFKHGRNFENLEDVEFLTAAQTMDEPIPLFTGEKNEDFSGIHERDARVVVQSDIPLPFTLLAIAPSSKLQDNV